MDVRLLWLHAFVLWLEADPVLDKESQERIRAALKRLQIQGGAAIEPQELDALAVRPT
jgi:hypothetical protein